ncbi:MAG: RluA family pseudouridine synthase [Fimbriiglobus sp.]|jgi:23S rRNA pseudouridine1911/1915/1917 synthase|nr:RluA family pseudouridine synthase [Fimbriiglobus sp.]
MADLDDDDLIPAPAPDALPAYARTRDPIPLLVKVKAEGMRLDHYLQVFFKDLSRSSLQNAILSGNVTCNGKPTKASYKVRNDDQLVVQLPAPVNDVIVPEDIPIEVLYEDEVLAVVNKPPNMVVHPARGNWTGTLVNALAFHFGDQLSKENGNFRLGIVHRLDRDTSGAILIAKADGIHNKLSQQFEKRTVFKEYVAIAQGEFERDSDYIEASLMQHPRDREKQCVAADPNHPDAKPAMSYYEVLEKFRGYTLVKVQPKTGRTHQIRVHLLHIGHPVLADKAYTGRSEFRKSDIVPGILPATADDEVYLSRQSLHAFRLRFRHPVKDNWLEVEAPLPADMRAALEGLREHRPYR